MVCRRGYLVAQQEGFPAQAGPEQRRVTAGHLPWRHLQSVTCWQMLLLLHRRRDDTGSNNVRTWRLPNLQCMDVLQLADHTLAKFGRG